MHLFAFDKAWDFQLWCDLFCWCPVRCGCTPSICVTMFSSYLKRHTTFIHRVTMACPTIFQIQHWQTKWHFRSHLFQENSREGCRCGAGTIHQRREEDGRELEDRMPGKGNTRHKTGGEAGATTTNMDGSLHKVEFMFIRLWWET
jgi:hypothetical protein